MSDFFNPAWPRYRPRVSSAPPSAPSAISVEQDDASGENLSDEETAAVDRSQQVTASWGQTTSALSSPASSFPVEPNDGFSEQVPNQLMVKNATGALMAKPTHITSQAGDQQQAPPIGESRQRQSPPPRSKTSWLTWSARLLTPNILLLPSGSKKVRKKKSSRRNSRQRVK